MDKSSGENEDNDWSDYEELKEISIDLPNTDNESSASEVLPRKRKRATRLMSNNNEPSGIANSSLEEWIWKEIDKCA